MFLITKIYHKSLRLFQKNTHNSQESWVFFTVYYFYFGTLQRVVGLRPDRILFYRVATNIFPLTGQLKQQFTLNSPVKGLILVAQLQL
jgi:hypothetical protein